MGVQDERVYTVSCDDCEDVLEDDFGCIHFDDEEAALNAAKMNSWLVGEGRYPDVACVLCRAKRVRAAEGKPEPRIEIPGQLDLLVMVTHA
jgi:hypothetical protein